ncbi:hypothetical protein OAG71_00960 [bacterium]|nr:hypothetical protein [bacterium]
MTDQNSTADTQTPNSSRLSLIAIVLILVGLVGAYASARSSQTLSNLLRQKRDFDESFGALNVEDPSQVSIVAVSPTATDLPPWVDTENVWIFRIHIPANYGVSWSANEGSIAADSPLSRGEGSCYSGVKSLEARELQIIITTSFEDGRLKGRMHTDATGLTFSPPNNLFVNSLDELVLDTIVKPGQPMQTFAIDEAICVWRIRSKKPNKTPLNDTQLYPGCVLYLHETSKYDAFRRWSNGKSSSMAELE